MKSYKISLVGSGNVAWHLATALENAGHEVLEIYSRTPAHAKALIGRLYNTQYKLDLDFTDSEAEVIIISVKDDAISQVAEDLKVNEKTIVAHTSGSKSVAELSYLPERIGVFYPLQTFSKSKELDWKNLPILIESDDRKSRKALKQIAQTLSRHVKEVDYKDRKALHIAAVFACNLTNHLLTISEMILNERKLELNLLEPLIRETIEKSLLVGPSNGQTGPAMRGDMEVLEAHMDYLKKNKKIAKIYRQISQNILDTYH